MFPAFPANGYAVEEVGMDPLAPPSIILTGAGTESVEPEVPEVEEGGDAVKVCWCRLLKWEGYSDLPIQYFFVCLQLQSVLGKSLRCSKKVLSFFSDKLLLTLYLSLCSPSGHHPCSSSIRT